MSKLTDALTAALTAVAHNPTNSLAVADASVVAQEVAQQLPPPAALEALWPQLARYAISILGAALMARGVGDAATWQALSGGLIAIAPPAYRVVTTLIARRS